MGLTLVRRIQFCIFSSPKQFACLLDVDGFEVSCMSVISIMYLAVSHMMFRNSIEFLQGEYPSLGFPGRERAPQF
jgi:hypothetical protein